MVNTSHMKQLTSIIILLGLVMVSCSTQESGMYPPNNKQTLSVRCGFSTTKVAHNIEDGYFKSLWQKGDTITVVIDDEYRYFVADNDGASTTFSLSDEHSSGFSKWDGLTAYAVTGRVEIKDNNYALLKENMAHQVYSSNKLPMDYQIGSATVLNSEVQFVFSYPCSFFRMSIPKKDITNAGGRIIVDITGDFPFLISNNMDEWVNEITLSADYFDPSSMSALDENDNWSGQSPLYPNLLLNIRSGRYIAFYDNGGTNYHRFDNSALYLFPESALEPFQDDDPVPFYVAFCPEYRIFPIDEYRYLIRVFAQNDREHILYEKCAPTGDLNNNTIYDVNLLDSYSSTDYSMDGEPVTIYQSSIGKGVDVVFMGEGYTDLDMGENGLYEKDMITAVEHLFSYEPLTSYKDYFNIYAVKVVSPHYNAHDSDSPINEVEQIRKYYNSVPGINTDILRVVVLKRFSTDVMKNDDASSEYTEPSYTMNYTDGSFIIRMNHKYNIRRILLHEFMHGIAKVADEYNTTSETIDEDTINEIKRLHSIGFCLNIDTTDNPEEIVWSNLLNDERFQDEGLGLYVGNPDFGDKKEGLDIFEGGWIKYEKGVFRPSYYSLMNNNHNGVWEEWMNAPTREALYKHVMSAAYGDGWIYDYEDFVNFDKSYRDLVKSSRFPNYSSALIQRDDESQNIAIRLAPPIIIKGSPLFKE